MKINEYYILMYNKFISNIYKNNIRYINVDIYNEYKNSINNLYNNIYCNLILVEYYISKLHQSFDAIHSYIYTKKIRYILKSDILDTKYMIKYNNNIIKFNKYYIIKELDKILIKIQK